MARRGGLVEDVLDIATNIPWWLSVVLAIVIYFALGPIAEMDVPKASNVKDAGEAAATQIYKTVAAIGQILIPVLFLIGALISAIKGWLKLNN
jgi:restriction system protein